MVPIECGRASWLSRKCTTDKDDDSDPLPFLFLGKQPLLCQGTMFVDVDYPALMRNKVDIIAKTAQLKGLLPKITKTGQESGLLVSSDPYLAIGCDLVDVIALQELLQDHLQLGDDGLALLFVSEVSTAYMDRAASQAIFDWTATYDDVRFCLLEQHLPDGPDHPFAATMLAHFQKLRSPLRAVGTMDEMKTRFVSAGYPESGTEIQSLWELWSDPMFLGPEERRALDKVEPFDEWEEFALFGSHYFLLSAAKESDADCLKMPRQAYKASLLVETTCLPMASISLDSKIGPDTAQDILYIRELQEPHNFRRFAAVVPSSGPRSVSIGLFGGLGTQERSDTCDTYCQDDAVQPVTGPPIRSGVMCHAITQLGNTSNCMFTGGRMSPDRANAESWLRIHGRWKRVQDLPVGRYRHCAVPIVLAPLDHPYHTILIYGGKTSDGDVLSEWLLWTGETGWKQVNVIGEAPPARFGAAMITDGRETASGILLGGMTSAGRVLDDMWHWTLEVDMTLHCRNVTTRASSLLKADAWLLGRFGAHMIRTTQGTLLVGGITGSRMLSLENEVLNMKTLRPQSIVGPRPLFIGHSVHDIDGTLLVLGGGATCFSFGTTWSRCYALHTAQSGSVDTQWRLQSVEEAIKPAIRPNSDHADRPMLDGEPRTKGSSPISIQEIHISPNLDFEEYVKAARPVIFKKCNIGSCTTAWTNSYLREAIGSERKVSVHVAESERMDFRKKNFQYITQDLGAFLDSVERGEMVYLRALSKNAPNQLPTVLAVDFPEIVEDFELPKELEYVSRNAHSSPLRISGPVHMWLHYDVMANVLCQVRGCKRLLLFPPSDVSRLGFEPGASSSSADVFDKGRFNPFLVDTNAHEAFLDPGDILFIPPMWLHTAAPMQGTSVAVNIFFRNLSSNGYAPGRDVYGNRDLAAYERGRKDVSRIYKSFEDLPPDVSGFYLERLAMEMLAKARSLTP